MRSVRHVLSFRFSQNNLSPNVSANLVRASRFYPKFGMMRKGHNMRLTRLMTSNVTYLNECLRIGIFGRPDVFGALHELSECVEYCLLAVPRLSS